MEDFIGLVGDFLNSQFFAGIATLLTGAFAYAVYMAQQRGAKKDAANIILLEIQNAERLILRAQEQLKANKLLQTFLIPEGSWDKYKYLFVRDFDRDGWDRISDFYTKCRLYDESVAHNNSYFQKNEEQIRVNMLRAPADYLKEHLERAQDPQITQDQLVQSEALAVRLAEEFQKLYLSKAADFLLYEPQKPINDARASLEQIDLHLSQSTIGTKLKKLAGVDSL